jgi:hypothetical protein
MFTGVGPARLCPAKLAGRSVFNAAFVELVEVLAGIGSNWRSTTAGRR